MKKFVFSMSLFGLSLAAAWTVDARDTKHILPIAAAMEVKDASEKLNGSVKFFFGTQKSPEILKKLGSFVSNRKTNAFGKSDEQACNWAFLSALVSFEKRAQELGANAVVNIVSYYKKNEMSSATEFECHAGAIIAGVALKGDFVTIADQ
ncbi:MAG TPA: excinuclease ATPase subunit [Candidatus Binatia bacterium]|nr:excinuclease ATPase subunit [Candidatus Binatia bacterium]